MKDASEITVENVDPRQNDNLLEIALKNDVEINHLCGGVGVCKSCAYSIEEGCHFIAHNEETDQRLEADCQYACQSFLKAGMCGRIIVSLDQE